MRVDQIKQRIKQLEQLINKPHQAESVKAELRKEVIRLETQFKNIKRCLLGESFKG